LYRVSPPDLGLARSRPSRGLGPAGVLAQPGSRLPQAALSGYRGGYGLAAVVAALSGIGEGAEVSRLPWRLSPVSGGLRSSRSWGAGVGTSALALGISSSWPWGWPRPGTFFFSFSFFYKENKHFELYP
jgi:hypothetical protein